MVLNRTYLHVAEYPVGINSRVEDINMLLCIKENDKRMIGIFGVGGIGKTTIAKEIYNCITDQFEGSCFLANIRESSKQDQGGLAKLQQTILYDILKDSSLKVSNVDRGINLIMERLCCKRILLVLDDVDCLDQLKKLCGRCDWFGFGSRIIITTRDEGLLTKHHVHFKYRMKEMDHHEALQLFSQHAFKSDNPDDAFADVIKLALNCAKGLPLALQVIGSNLYGEDIHFWKSKLEKYKKIPEENIHKKLKISYDGLDYHTKKIFLDIACFFKGDDREYVTKILDGCGFFADAGIKKLNDKCLITIDKYDLLGMHDLLEDMGKEIVRQESPEEPGKRSRLWFHDDVRDVLERNKFKQNLTRIDLSNCRYLTNISDLSSCSNLEKLILDGCISLVEVDNSVGFLDKLVELDFRDCFQLKKLPRSFKLISLKVLELYGCTSLEYFPEIECEMKHLKTLYLSGSGIVSLPPCIEGFVGLFVLDLTCCEQLEEILHLPPNIKHLRTLNLSGSDFVSLSPCIERLVGLFVIKLRFCNQLEEILCLPLNIEQVDASGCSSLKSFLPKSNYKLSRLRELNLCRTGIVSIPPCIEGCFGLSKLNLRDCKQLEEILYLPPNIGEVDAGGCSSLKSFLPKSNNSLSRLREVNLCCSESVDASGCSSLKSFLPKSNNSLSRLREVNLYLSGIVSLPPCIEGFVGLSKLDLRYCKQLEEILHLPPNIESVEALECVLLERFPHVST
ncbi:hypothetical protein I3760_15G140300, partial [Carya illinoinensis]